MDSLEGRPTSRSLLDAVHGRLRPQDQRFPATAGLARRPSGSLLVAASSNSRLGLTAPGAAQDGQAASAKAVVSRPI
jgi:hypothetical protein